MSDWYWRDGTKVEGPDFPAPGWQEKMHQVEEKLGDRAYKVVDRTVLPDGKLVSTVWLGLDHGHGSVPIIFETMVFETEDTRADCLEQDRYATEAEAKAGHVAMVGRFGGVH